MDTETLALYPPWRSGSLALNAPELWVVAVFTDHAAASAPLTAASEDESGVSVPFRVPGRLSAPVGADAAERDVWSARPSFRRVVPNWWRAEGHSLILDDLGDVLDELPTRLVVGTGASGLMRPAPGTLEALRSRGIEVTVAPTDEAVRLFAQADPASTAAALHLTC